VFERPYAVAISTEMVMAALAGTLKAWFALRLPETGGCAARHDAETAAVIRMEFIALLRVAND
jgi:hypothetical protein